MTGELFEAIKFMLSTLDGAEKRQMIKGLRYGCNFALTIDQARKGSLYDEPLVREFFEWLDAQ
jgi:hypothetical protein